MTGPNEKRKRPFQKSNQKDKPQTDNTYADSYIVKAFEKYAADLDAKHDKHERLVKLSRDVIISSKRIIFSIHALMRSSNYDIDVSKIQESFETLKENLLKNIAKELENEDHYQFIRAYFWGLQEYIEAVTFFHYVTTGKLFNFGDLLMNFSFPENPTPMDIESGIVHDISSGGDHIISGQSSESHVLLNNEVSKTLSLAVEVPDYILGVQDLTGELMRFCINSFASNRLPSGFSSCEFVRRLYSAMVSLCHVPSKEFSKKLTVARQSLEKMEMACYTTRVRGSEALNFQLERADESTDNTYSVDF